MKTPILFLIFNRPDQTRRVFAEIKKAKPEKLFIAGDGPRTERPEDVEKCKRAREIADEVDWPCEIKTLFQEKNLGCKLGAATGITWFFENVEEGIILEDDCLPDQSFFPFCEQMLEHYRNEEKIAMICGYNIGGISDIKFSYTFSRYGHIWGWASWRRVWERYDITMKLWSDKKNWKKIKHSMGDRQQWNYRQLLYDETFLGKKDTWDYQWESFRVLHKELSVIPSRNLIENLGFGADATHTTQISSPLIIPRRTINFPIIHNPQIQPDDSYDVKLRPKMPVRSMRARRIKDIVKKLLKNVAPPILYKLIRKLVRKTKTLTPVWNELKYEPLNGIKIFFDPTGSWQRKMINGSYDSFLFDRLKTMETKGKVFFDIGAHIGFHSLYFARLAGKEGGVYSFEPNQKNIERFKFILENNKDLEKIKIFNIAVSNTYGTEEFDINDDIESGRSSGNFIKSADTFFSKEIYENKGFIKTKVTTVSIDDFKEKLDIDKSPDIIKIDVEGAEYSVLLGAEKTLVAKKPILFIEIHSISNMFNVASFLHSLSYDLKILKKETNGICFIEASPKIY